MESEEIETRLEKQIERLEKLKQEIGSSGNRPDFQGYDKGGEFPLVGVVDSETMEKYVKEYERFRHIIQKKGFGLNNRRSEMEIIANILDIARKGVKKTKILYKANLSYVQLKNYVSFLLEKGLLKKVENEYSTTKKGTLFLITWQNTLMLLE